MRKISKSALRANMASEFREVEISGEMLVVTSHGRPVLQISPYLEKMPCSEVFRDLRGKVKINRKVALQGVASFLT